MIAQETPENVAPISKEEGKTQHSKHSKFTQLPIYEMVFNFLVWFSAVGYASYQVYVVGQDYFNQYFLDIYNDFQPGWSWIGRKQDAADLEWVHGLKNLNILLPYWFIHLIVSEFLKNSGRPKLIPLWHIMTGALFTVSYLGVQTLFLFILQPFLYYGVVQLKRKSVIWLVTISLLVTIHYLFDWTTSVYSNTEYLNYECKMQLTTVTLGWINLRCLNFFLDAVDDDVLREFHPKNVIKILAYCLYLPLMYFGPLILYSDFISTKWNEKDAVRTPFLERFECLLSNLIRFCFWLFLAQFALHYFYISAIPFQVDLIKEMNYFSLYGLGYLMGQFFHMKYVIFYGISTSLTFFELEIPVPRTPKCIGRIHLYSDMWKHFDRGLYLFLVKYIFKPTAQKAGRLIGSLLCFAFIYIWHGIQTYLLIWSTLNYIGVTLEMVGKKVANSEVFQKTINDIMDAQTFRRFSCVIASPLFAMSALSFFYFGGGKEVGDIFVQRLLYGPPKVKFAVIFILYCGSQVSMQVKHIEEELKNKHLRKQVHHEHDHHHHHHHHHHTTSGQFMPEEIFEQAKPKPKKTLVFSDKLIKFKSTSQIDEKLNERFNPKRQHVQRPMYLENLKSCSKMKVKQPTELKPEPILDTSRQSRAFLDPVSSKLSQNTDSTQSSISSCRTNEIMPRSSLSRPLASSNSKGERLTVKKSIRFEDISNSENTLRTMAEGSNSPAIPEVYDEERLKFKAKHEDDLYVKHKPKKDHVKYKEKVKYSERSFKDLSPKRLYELYKNTFPKDKKRKDSENKS